MNNEERNDLFPEESTEASPELTEKPSETEEAELPVEESDASESAGEESPEEAEEPRQEGPLLEGPLPDMEEQVYPAAEEPAFPTLEAAEPVGEETFFQAEPPLGMPEEAPDPDYAPQAEIPQPEACLPGDPRTADLQAGQFAPQPGYPPMPPQGAQAPWPGYPPMPPQGAQAPQPGYPPVPPQGAQAPWPGYPPMPPQGAQASQPGYPPMPPQGAQAPQPGYYPPYGQQAWPYGGTGVAAPKKKMSTGLKVFLWIAAALAAAAIVGFGVFLIYRVATTVINAVQQDDFYFPYGEYYSEYDFDDPFDREEYPFTFPENPGEDDEESDEESDEEDDIPRFDDGVIPPDDTENDADQPDVDITPNNEGITIKSQADGKEMSAQEVYSRVVKSTVTVAAALERNGQENDSTGTGIIATSDGYIITNAHVVMNSKSTAVKITTYDGQTYDAVVVGVDRTTDVAVLKTNDYNFTPAEFGDADELVIGDSVVAIGNPGGAKFSGSMTGGYISGLNREVGTYSENGMTYIQTDAAINPGNSGGPLVNMYGQVVGINSSKIISEGYEGMGFAIPVSKAKNIIDQLLSGGYVKGRVRLGITGSDVSFAVSSMYGVPQGFMVKEIGEDSAFSGTDVQEGDIIVALDGETVTCLDEISNLLLKYAPGDSVAITLYRPTVAGSNGSEYTVTVTLLEDKGETQK